MVIVVLVAKQRVEGGLFVPDHECANVNGIANPPIRPDHNESSRSVPGARRATADSREEPEAPPVQPRPSATRMSANQATGWGFAPARVRINHGA